MACARNSPTNRLALRHQRRGQPAQLLQRKLTGVLSQNLQRDVVGTGVVMSSHTCGDGVHISPCNRSINEPITERFGQIFVTPPEAPPIVRVVRQEHVMRNELAADCARFRRIGLEHRKLFGREETVGAEFLASPQCVFDRNEIRVCARRTIAGESEHARTKGGKNPGCLRRDVWRRGFIHRVEIRRHLFDRLCIVVAAALGPYRMTHADTEQEPVRIPLGKRPRAVRHRHWVAGPKARDPRGNRHPFRSGQQQAGVRESLLRAEPLRHPEGSEPEVLDLRHQFPLAGGGLGVERKGPHADATQLGRELLSRDEISVRGCHLPKPS